MDSKTRAQLSSFIQSSLDQVADQTAKEILAKAKKNDLFKSVNKSNINSILSAGSRGFSPTGMYVKKPPTKGKAPLWNNISHSVYMVLFSGSFGSGEDGGEGEGEGEGEKEPSVFKTRAEATAYGKNQPGVLIVEVNLKTGKRTWF